MPDSQAHSPAMGQEDGEKWTAAVDLQPAIPKSDRLLALLTERVVDAIVKLGQADRIADFAWQCITYREHPQDFPDR